MPLTHPQVFKPATLETTIGGGITAVEKYPTKGDFPSPGIIGVIYIALDTDKAYLWDDATMDYLPIDTTLNLVDNLVSTDKTKALTANMGRVLNEKFVFMEEPNGFGLVGDGEVDRDSSIISFSDSGPDRTFSIQPFATNFKYYYQGEEYVSTGDTVQIPDSEGLYFIYYEGSQLKFAVATSSSEKSVIQNNVFVAAIYWDATNKTAIYIGDERHGSKMDGHAHILWHLVKGTSYLSGLPLTDILVDQSGNLDTHAQFGTALGEIKDEDITHVVLGIPSTTGLPVFYKDGSLGNWRRQINSGFSVLTTGTGRLAWNEFTGGSWQLTEATNNGFILCHIFATNDIGYQNIAIMGQAVYINIIAAREGANVEINNLVTSGLPFKEYIPIASVIFQTSDSYSNAVEARVRTTDLGADYVDWRLSGISPASASVNDHGNLAGLEDDDHLIYHNDARGDIRYYQKTEFITLSTGAPDAGKPVALDAEGHIDASMINDADISHSLISGTHNLTTDIDHNSISNTHNLTSDIDHNSILNTHNLTTDIDHDSLTNYSIGQHRIINDGGTSATILWSAEKIISSLDTKIDKTILTTKGDILSRTATVLSRIVIGGNGQVLVADSNESSGLKWVDNNANSASVLVTIENDSGDLNNDIKFYAGRMWNTAKTEFSSLPQYTKQLDATFSEGDNGGALGQGLSKTADTWFHWLAITKDSDTSIKDYYADTDIAGSNIPTGWTVFKWINASLTDGSGNILPITQTGYETNFKIPKNDFSGSLHTAAVLRTLSVPPGIITEALFTVGSRDITTSGAGAIYGLVTSPAQADTAPSVTIYNFSTYDGAIEISYQSLNYAKKTNTSSQIRFRFNSVAATQQYEIISNGWKIIRSD